MKNTVHCIWAFLIVCCLATTEQSFNFKENALYIYNFVRYTEFPEKKTSISIGIIGNTLVDQELQTIINQKNAGYSIKHISVADCKTVDVIIVAKSSSKQLKEVNKATEKKPILIITEKPDLNFNGACISLFMDEEDHFKTKFQVSPYNLRLRNLKLSAQILNNAIIVR